MELAGNIFEIRVSATKFTQKTDGYVVGNMNSNSYNKTVEFLDTTAFGDSYKKRKGGLKDTEGSLKGDLNLEDAGQLLFDIGDTLWIARFPQGSSEAGTQMPVIVESINENAEVSGKQEIEFSYKGNGAPETLA